MPILARTGSSTPSSTNVVCPSFGEAGDRFACFGKQVVLKISAGDRDPQRSSVLIQQRHDGLGGAHGTSRIVRIGSLRRVIGERQIDDVACERAEMIQAKDEWKRTRP